MEKNNLLPFEKHKRQILIRKKAETSDKFGCIPENMPVKELINYGIVNIDKPSGPTSHQVSDYVQKILSISKAGHSGTLDPGVTGVLPLAIGRATRVVQLLLTAGKEYIALMHVHKDVSENKITEVCSKFVGRIDQIPPIKSAVKRRKRQRSVYYIDIMEINERDVLFKVGCEAGTYIRKLIHDIGKQLGCGAHMVELRRTKAGPFNELTNLVTMQDLTDAFYYFNEEKNEKYIRYCIQPIEEAVEHLLKIYVLDSAVDSLCHGANLNLPGISQLDSGIEKQDIVAVMTLKKELICYGIAKMSSKEMLGEKGLAVKTDKVFMLPGTYPKIEKS
ncbi:MAG: RNA-guided pseudouridylation complex pseudouridine synthase subunit Cbf5 [Candidatus Nanoarchaeia archaeon]|nr:RNA-guided pseudouridylation complex pseudouridine synthase subunit Cbf5 [Candidatus Nanoarchaeia archaeon]